MQESFYPSEQTELQFRYEVFNLTNHPSFSVPKRNVRPPAGGTTRGTNTTLRQMQLGSRIMSQHLEAPQAGGPRNGPPANSHSETGGRARDLGPVMHAEHARLQVLPSRIYSI